MAKVNPTGPAPYIKMLLVLFIKNKLDVCYCSCSIPSIYWSKSQILIKIY